jgi:inner membrane transporter RhtA
MAALAGLLVLSQALGPREVIALVLVTAASVGVTVGVRRRRLPAEELPPAPVP